MPSAMGVNNGPPPRDQETGGDADASSHDGGPVLVSLNSRRVQDRQRTLAEKKKKEEEQLALKKKKEKEHLALKVQQRATAREAAREENEETSNKEADPVDETATTSGAMEAGRRRGRNEDEEEDDEERERATKQQGVGSPMRTATGGSRKDPPESPLRVEEVDMSLEGNEGSSSGKPPGAPFCETGGSQVIKLRWGEMALEQLHHGTRNRCQMFCVCFYLVLMERGH